MIRHLSHDFTQYAVEPGAFEMRRAQFYEWILIELLHNTCTLCSLHTKPVLGDVYKRQIHDYTGAVVGGLSISGPTTRLNERTVPDIARRVKQAGELISQRMGYHPE